MFLPARCTFASVFFSRTLAMPQKPTDCAFVASRSPLSGTREYPGSGAHGVHEDTKVTASIFNGSTKKSRYLAETGSIPTGNTLGVWRTFDRALRGFVIGLHSAAAAATGCLLEFFALYARNRASGNQE